MTLRVTLKGQDRDPNTLRGQYLENGWRHNTVRCKPKVETVTKTGSTNNLATETNIDAISAGPD